ncbi:hypothetical protein Harman_13710 [Haloarcula mannanilytica]|uniref:Bacteriorhodopsin n=1 Tax=Haloarcula mannanilytica TaxID=2509225 RepID=A0A4C2EG47_9EURY|nr:bacteriorhodopsin [Haloarcula mannanilytica]GCF13436.1 hypothetical protein Harman_13710 [Haloarcula mannanilytica]
MSSTEMVLTVSALVYTASLVVLLAWLRRLPAAKRRYCYPVVGVVGFATVMTALSALGIGFVDIAGSETDLPKILDDFVTYSTLYVVTVLLANESHRTLAIVAGIPLVQVLAFNVAAIAGGPIALAGILVAVVGHGVLAYLFAGPIWRRADALPDDQRLLHWKSRNLLLFLTGMLIAYAIIAIGNVFDPFVITVLSEYIGLLIRVGFAGFLFANVDAITVDKIDLTEVVSETFAGQSAD